MSSQNTPPAQALDLEKLVQIGNKFITAYRKLEQAPPSVAKQLIRQVADTEQVAAHLCNSWDGRGQDFGDFYLNLSHKTQYRILRAWELGDDAGEAYEKKVTENAMAPLFTKMPLSIWWPHELLKFFYNHGISQKPAKDVSLPRLPAEDKQYGNSTNWGDYILGISPGEQTDVLNQIIGNRLGVAEATLQQSDNIAGH